MEIENQEFMGKKIVKIMKKYFNKNKSESWMVKKLKKRKKDFQTNSSN